MSVSTPDLIRRLRTIPDRIEAILRDGKLTAEVQEADVNDLCWAAVGMLFQLQETVSRDLYGTEGDAA